MKENPMEKRIALFEVKALDGSDPNGEFEAILSVPTIDRDGEIIDGRAFEPLPAEIPIHKFHDFSSPVATATPFYEGDVLKARGTFDPDPESQAIRAKVGRSIRYMSVGFMAATRSDQDGTPHITKAELLEASFVSVPSNREAAILAVKQAGKTDPNAASAVFTNTVAWPSTTTGTSITVTGLTDGLALGKQISAELKRGRVLSAKNEGDLRQAVALFTNVLEQLAAPADGSAPKSPTATDPEEKAAAPVAAVEPPADVPVGWAEGELLIAEAEMPLPA
jgi:HK97 family phage prohead protease